MMLAGPIVPTILVLAAPNVLNVAMMSLVSISDSWFVSQLGIVDLAALALVFPTQMALGQMSAGAMGGGISSSVARALGSGDRAAAEAAAAHALVIAIGMAALFAIVFVGFGRQIYGALGGSGRALDGAEAFASVLFLGCAAPWIANSMASVLRGTGDMKTPGYALVLTAALQIPLTGALTLGWFGLPALGIRGPAIASVISFTFAAIWMASTTLVGTNIGARQYVRAQRLAWIGALMAGAIAAAIGLVVAIWPDLWLGLFTSDPGALASGRIYLSIVGPVYGFFGLAMALYFASQGTGEMVWPVVANLSRITIAVCGSLLALDVLFSVVLAFSTTRRAWRGA